jgi:hypothetical protein
MSISYNEVTLDPVPVTVITPDDPVELPTTRDPKLLTAPPFSTVIAPLPA